MNYIYPLRLSGIAKETIWGGDKIGRLCETELGKKTGELWVLSARKKEDCMILNGKHKGTTLTEFLSRYMPDCLPFPLLIKFIDANDRLSVQVHPNDEIAAELGGDAAGKTEMWHIIEAEDGASIIYGIKEGVSKDELKKAVDEGRVEEVLNYVPVKSGDTFFIPAGLVHAIGKGILLAEVQQNSDTTYRFYDYGRRDAHGNTRELHIEKALTATKMLNENDIDAFRYGGKTCSEDSDILADCEYFKVIKKDIDGSFILDIGDDAFCSVVCLSGKAELNYSEGTERVSSGDSFLIPCGADTLEFRGKASLLISVSKK